MKILLLLGLIVLISMIAAQPLEPDNDYAVGLDAEQPVGLLDVADFGDSHSNTADRNARQWGGGRGGWGGGGWGGRGGWGGGGWGGRGGWGGGGRGWGGGGGGWGGRGGWGGGWG